MECRNSALHTIFPAVEVGGLVLDPRVAGYLDFVDGHFITVASSTSLGSKEAGYNL